MLTNDQIQKLVTQWASENNFDATTKVLLNAVIQLLNESVGTENFSYEFVKKIITDERFQTLIQKQYNSDQKLSDSNSAVTPTIALALFHLLQNPTKLITVAAEIYGKKLPIAVESLTKE